MDNPQQTPSVAFDSTPMVPRPALAEALDCSGLPLRGVSVKARDLGRPVSKDTVRQMRAAALGEDSRPFTLRKASAVAAALDRPVDELFQTLAARYAEASHG